MSTPQDQSTEQRTPIVRQADQRNAVTITTPAATKVISDLTFPEGPRWRDGRLWFSDFYAHEVLSWAPGEDAPRHERSVPQQPSGLGWLNDGRMLIVSMKDAKLMVDGPNGLTDYADLASASRFWCNDMLVTDDHAYVGNFGFNYEAGESITPTCLAHVFPDGTVERATEDLLFPNGIGILDDDRLIVAETWGNRLTSFARDTDGRLSDRRVFAQLPETFPDGLCVDAKGYVWVADASKPRVIVVHPAGTVIGQVDLPERALATCLGGPDGTTLFVASHNPRLARDERGEARAGNIWAVDVAGVVA